MLGLKLNHVSKRGHWSGSLSMFFLVKLVFDHTLYEVTHGGMVVDLNATRILT